MRSVRRAPGPGARKQARDPERSRRARARRGGPPLPPLRSVDSPDRRNPPPRRRRRRRSSVEVRAPLDPAGRAPAQAAGQARRGSLRGTARGPLRRGVPRDWYALRGFRSHGHQPSRSPGIRGQGGSGHLGRAVRPGRGHARARGARAIGPVRGAIRADLQPRLWRVHRRRVGSGEDGRAGPGVDGPLRDRLPARLVVHLEGGRRRPQGPAIRDRLPHAPRRRRCGGARRLGRGCVAPLPLLARARAGGLRDGQGTERHRGARAPRPEHRAARRPAGQRDRGPRLGSSGRRPHPRQAKHPDSRGRVRGAGNERRQPGADHR